MPTKADYFTFALDLVRRQFPTPRLVDRMFRAELEERAIKEHNDAIHVQAVRESLTADLDDPIDPRRC